MTASRRRRLLTDAEKALWVAVLKDVQPLPGRSADEPAPPEQAITASAPRPQQPPLRPVLPPPPPAPRVSLPVLDPKYYPGLDRRTAEKFCEGGFAIDGRIDLHGLTQDVAHERVLVTLSNAAAAGKRCILVITGKGSLGEGVLRTELPRWLNEARLRPLILAFSPAQPQHGGSGAFYVLLKRRRA